MKRWVLAFFSVALAGFGVWAAWKVMTPSAPPLTKDSAMKMAVGEFNAAHHGTLSPLNRTGRWDIKKADRLITPMLFQTYTEGGVHKAVLMTHAQMLEGGEPYVSHAQSADLTFYVFKQEHDSWRLEKRSRKPLKAGSYGEAPPGDLIHVGPDKLAVLIKQGYMNMGEGYLSLSLIGLSEPSIDEIFSIQTQGDNSGGCTHDPEELKQPGAQPCWHWDTRITAHPRPGSEHFVLKAVSSGTRMSDDPSSKVISNEGVTYYTFQGSSFQEAAVDPSELEPAVNEPALSSTK